MTATGTGTPGLEAPTPGVVVRKESGVKKGRKVW